MTTETFTASNGIGVQIKPNGYGQNHMRELAVAVSGDGTMFRVAYSAAQITALAEFFQARRDVELGLWRWPEDPRYVVKPVNEFEVAVVNEEQFWDGTGATVHIRDARECVHARPLSDKAAAYKRAAQAYWWEHREPWEFAKHEEVWQITAHGDTGPALATTAHRHGIGLRFQTATGDLIYPEDITHATRLHPTED